MVKKHRFTAVYCFLYQSNWRKAYKSKVLCIVPQIGKVLIQYQRIYDRIFDMCVPLCVDGVSKRLPSEENKCEYMESVFEKGGAL